MTPPPRIYRVGLVGAGYVSEFHIKALQRLSQVQIIGITDLDTMRAQSVAARFNLTPYPSLEAMGHQGLDVVHVMTPPAGHTGIALDAMRLGCHVLVEKPLATTVEECDQLAAESAARGLQICVNHSMLGDPIFRQTVKAIRNGAVGDVLTADIFRSSIFPPYRGGPLPPQYVDGGYPFRDIGVHALCAIREILGPIEDFSSQFWFAGKRSLDPNVYFDEWRVLLRCARGSGHITLSWNVRPLQHLLIVQGTGGTLRADISTMFVTKRRNTPAPKAIERVLNALGESASEVAGVTKNVVCFALGRVVQYQGLHDFVREFYECLAAGRPMPASIESGREIVYWNERIAQEADEAKRRTRPHPRRDPEPAIVVTGANGHLGRALVRRLLANGERVRLFVRQEQRDEFHRHPRCHVFLGELGDPAGVLEGLANATGVYHCGAATTGGWPAHESGTIAGTRNVVEACLQHGIKKLVYVSSLSVLRQIGVGPVVTESSPLEPRPEERGAYTRSKLEAEQIVCAAVRERGLHAVIVRPGLIWSEEILLPASVAMRAGNRLVMIGDRNLLLPLVHVDDVVTAMILAMGNDIPAGEIFHLVDDDIISREQLVRLYIAAREPRLRLTHVPMVAVTSAAGLLRGVTRLLGRPLGPSSYRLRSGVAPLPCDCTKAHTQLGWTPTVKSGTALRALLRPS